MLGRGGLLYHQPAHCGSGVAGEVALTLKLENSYKVRVTIFMGLLRPS
jgi:hypothetical protein